MVNATRSPSPILDASSLQDLDPACGLMVRVAQGDVGAFTSLYDATAPRIFGLACRILRNRSMAEEVTQEVMLELWSTASRFDPRLLRHTSALTDLQRQAITLVYEQGYSYSEIALLLDVKLPTIRARIRGAQLALHKSLTGKPRPVSQRPLDNACSEAFRV